MIVITCWMVLFLLLNIFFISVNALLYIPICLILLSVSYQYCYISFLLGIFSLYNFSIPLFSTFLYHYVLNTLSLSVCV